MPDFKTKYSRYRHNRRVRKHETRQKAENPKEFKENVNKRKQKQEKRQKEEDPIGFRENHNKRVKKNEERQKAENPKEFKERARQRKEKSSKNINACKRLQNFRRRVQFGPIFICSSCHQKLFENQVLEITEGIREQIYKVDPGIMEVCIDEEVEVDLGRNGAGNEIKSSYLCKSCNS